MNDDISYLEVTEGDSRGKKKKKRMSKNKVEIKQERKFNKKVLEEKKNSISWVSWKVYHSFFAFVWDRKFKTRKIFVWTEFKPVPPKPKQIEIS